MKFIGRTKELQILREPPLRGEAELVAIYGRRRVGKTALIEEAFKGKLLFKFEGLEGQSEKNQLEHFRNHLKYYLPSNQVPEKLTTWHVAFEKLSLLLKTHEGTEVAVLFDEFQWMAEMKSFLISLLKSYWDNDFSRISNCKLILCGSVSSFIVKKVIRSKALYGRISKEIQLQPLHANQVQSFLEGWSSAELLNAYLTLGGIPEYLNRLDPAESLTQNLTRLAFSPHGYFLNEFQRLFVSHFGSSDIYEKIVRALSDGPKNLDQITKALKIKSGGTLSSKLEDLVLAGFIDRYYPLGKGEKSNSVRFRIFDEYLHFYFKFIEPNLREIISGEIIPEQVLLHSSHTQWLGYSFERMCLKNSALLADYLRFSGISYRSGSWFKRSDDISAQIDLAFVRADKVIVGCEIKNVNKIDTASIVATAERHRQALAEDFTGYAIQMILMSAKRIDIPNDVRRVFSRILFADEVFLGGKE